MKMGSKKTVKQMERYIWNEDILATFAKGYFKYKFERKKILQQQLRENPQCKIRIRHKIDWQYIQGKMSSTIKVSILRSKAQKLDIIISKIEEQKRNMKAAEQVNSLRNSQTNYTPIHLRDFIPKMKKRINKNKQIRINQIENIYRIYLEAKQNYQEQKCQSISQLNLISRRNVNNNSEIRISNNPNVELRPRRLGRNVVLQQNPR